MSTRTFERPARVPPPEAPTGELALAAPYAGYQQMWDESYIGLNDILARIGVLLAQRNAEYLSTEQANTASWA